MKRKIHRIIKIPVILITLFIGLIVACTNKGTANIEKDNISTYPSSTLTSEKSEEYAVEAPPFSDGIYPCSECHASIDANPVRRELVDMHEEISEMFNHDSKNRWCLDCHDLNNRDSLRLASGKLLDFKESYKLCGQCHGEKYRDWKFGVHGKRTGNWNGKKEYLLCVHCHNPHSPKFQEITPEPPPVRQETIK